ncbi:MAG: UDP-N-acetylmuramoyl-L-alanyl-D-glutamate--2,6-diaminopimelate ligase [Longicatena sp.]
MKLSNLFENAPDIEITGLCIDSRKAKQQDLYFCMDGMVHDGHEFIDDVIDKGVKCIVHSKPLAQMKKGIAYIQVEDVNRTLNRVASLFYGHPSRHMTMFGVTGTNGKSTITSIIKDVYSNFFPCGYIGTISISYGDVVLPPSLTTPDPILIHKSLDSMRKAGIKACALEVSSHGLELGRVQSVDFDVAIFSNLTYDHLDFHGTIENYFEAKKKLFTQLKPSGVAILNIDDPYYTKLYEASNARVVSYGIAHNANYRADHISIGTSGSTFTLLHDQKSYEIQTNLVAMYNIYNLLAAIAAMCESGIELETLIPYLNTLTQIEGRMERIDEGQLFNVIVDFAHTPDGLEKVFEYAKSITEEEHSIIAVFGSAGKRDTKKRKVFGEIADKYCDSIILTEDDPRDESAREIANEIKSGIKETNNIFIEDRYSAIRQAIESANVNDTVLILGKGDEIFMYREFGREPWLGDHNVARHCIRKYCLGIEDDIT